MRQKSGLVKHSVSVGELRSAMLPPGGSPGALTHKDEGLPRKQRAGEERAEGGIRRPKEGNGSGRWGSMKGRERGRTEDEGMLGRERESLQRRG